MSTINSFYFSFIFRQCSSNVMKRLYIETAMQKFGCHLFKNTILRRYESLYKRTRKISLTYLYKKFENGNCLYKCVFWSWNAKFTFCICVFNV